MSDGMAIHIIVLLWTFIQPIHTSSACSPSPIVLPVTNVDLPNGQTRRGILASVGTPPQNVSMLANTFLNDTWIYNITQPLCLGQTTEQCFTLRGGLYDPDNSTTSTHHDTVDGTGGDPSDGAREYGKHLWINSWSNDQFTVGNASIQDYAIGMPGLDFGGARNPQANLGLGLNSTILSRLKDEGHIASRSWSFWWGVGNSKSSNAMDGHIILGGYDAAKIQGVPITRPLQPPSENCWSGMTISLTNMILVRPNYTTKDINPSNIISGCVSPDFVGVMTIPRDPYFTRFEEETHTYSSDRSTGYHWWQPLYPSSDVYNGGLQIQVDSGPKIEIPNDVLVVPDVDADKSGASSADDSEKVLLLSPLESSNQYDVPLIGMDFFSNAYLTVNLDNSTWSLWSAKRTTDTKLVAITDQDCKEAASDRTETSASDSATTSAAASSGTLSSGAIAGAAVGGAAAVLVLVGMLVLVILRRRKARNQDSNKPALSETPPDHFPPETKTVSGDAHAFDHWQPGTGELPGNTAHPAELYALRDPVELQQRYTYKEKRGNTRGDAVELPAANTPQI